MSSSTIGGVREKWVMKIGIDGGKIVVEPIGKATELPPVAHTCLGRHTLAALTQKARLNTQSDR